MLGLTIHLPTSGGGWLALPWCNCQKKRKKFKRSTDGKRIPPLKGKVKKAQANRTICQVHGRWHAIFLDWLWRIRRLLLGFSLVLAVGKNHGRRYWLEYKLCR